MALSLDTLNLVSNSENKVLIFKIDSKAATLNSESLPHAITYFSCPQEHFFQITGYTGSQSCTILY